MHPDQSPRPPEPRKTVHRHGAVDSVDAVEEAPDDVGRGGGAVLELEVVHGDAVPLKGCLVIRVCFVQAHHRPDPAPKELLHVLARLVLKRAPRQPGNPVLGPEEGDKLGGDAVQVEGAGLVVHIVLGHVEVVDGPGPEPPEVDRPLQALDARQRVQVKRGLGPRGVAEALEGRGPDAGEGQDGILWGEAVVEHQVDRQHHRRVGEALGIRRAVVHNGAPLQTRVLPLGANLVAEVHDQADVDGAPVRAEARVPFWQVVGEVEEI
mmetsp:Transcript_30605/g.77454  ORF Transcript_30605/g.77454 Transcript_30605/m.77454 type:complete len:265 (+) Transcript_30605:270-1064(+)